MTNPSFLTASTLATLLIGLSATANAQDRYTTHSFEAPTYQPGTLPETSIFATTGQDDWLLLAGAASDANVGTATIQTSVVRSGEQAMQWDAAAMSGSDQIELRRNAFFDVDVNQVVFEAEMDVMVESSANPSVSWSLFSQSFPVPVSQLFQWQIRDTGEIWMFTGQYGVSVTTVMTGFFLTKDVWHHTRTVVDGASNEVELFVDGQLVGTTTVLSSAGPDLIPHAFTQWTCFMPGDDKLFLDNFIVRTRPHDELALSVDLDAITSGAPTVVDFNIAGGTENAGRLYLILGSLSGTSPGLPISPGVTLPLNVDAFTDANLQLLNTPFFPGFFGVLGADGEATAQFDSLGPLDVAFAGLTMTFAGMTLFDSVSETVTVEVN